MGISSPLPGCSCPAIQRWYLKAILMNFKGDSSLECHTRSYVLYGVIVDRGKVASEMAYHADRRRDSCGLSTRYNMTRDYERRGDENSSTMPLLKFVRDCDKHASEFRATGARDCQEIPATPRTDFCNSFHPLFDTTTASTCHGAQDGGPAGDTA